MSVSRVATAKPTMTAVMTTKTMLATKTATMETTAATMKTITRVTTTMTVNDTDNYFSMAKLTNKPFLQK